MTRIILTGGLIAAAMTACAPATETAPSDANVQAWRCDAEGARSLIGSHVGAVSFPENAEVRTACTTCAVTEDYRADRLTLYFDEDTGLIERVACG